MLCYNFESIIFEGYLLMFFVLYQFCVIVRGFIFDKFHKFLLHCITQFS